MRQPVTVPRPPAPPAPAGVDYLYLLEGALTARRDAVLTLERLLVGPHTPAVLAQARQRVEDLAAACGVLLTRVERTSGMRPAGPPLR